MKGGRERVELGLFDWAREVADRGIVLTGGGALLTGLEQLLEERLGITTMTAEEPTTCVAVGTGKYIEVMNSIRD